MQLHLKSMHVHFKLAYSWRLHSGHIGSLGRINTNCKNDPEVKFAQGENWFHIQSENILTLIQSLKNDFNCHFLQNTLFSFSSLLQHKNHNLKMMFIES